MTNHTAALKAGPIPRLMLWELAPLVARALCEQRDEATGVQDGDLKPPAAWRPELKKRRLEFINRELTIALEQFDSSDPFVATTSLAHARKRKEYEAQKRKMVGKRASDIVARLVANEKKQQATEEIQLALHAAMMDPKATVQATSEAGERRQLDRVEIVEAGIDHVRNRLEIRGSWWCDVEVECDGFAPASDAIATAESAMDPQPTELMVKLSPVPPTYPSPVMYSSERVPEEFSSWADAQHKAGVIITVPMAEDTMRGVERRGGLLMAGRGLSRETIRAWIKSLPNGWYALRGETPSRRRTS